MKITKRQLKRIIRENTSSEYRSWYHLHRNASIPEILHWMQSIMKDARWDEGRREEKAKNKWLGLLAALHGQQEKSGMPKSDLVWDPRNEQNPTGAELIADLFEKVGPRDNWSERYHNTPAVPGGSHGEVYDTHVYSHSDKANEGRNRIKITKKQLRRIIKEELQHVNESLFSRIFGKKVKSMDDVETVGDLKKLLQYAASAKRGKQGAEAATDFVKDSIWDETLGKIPGFSTAKNAADILKAMYDMPDEARTGTAFDYLDVDDRVSEIVDDPIENAFLKAYAEEIEDLDDSTPLRNVNVTSELSKYLKNEFDTRTVTGFNEGRNRMKITKKQLKKIIKEEYRKLRRAGLIKENPRDFQITSMAGMDAYGPHTTLWDALAQAEREDPGSLDYAIDWAHDIAAGISSEEWSEMYHSEGVLIGLDEYYWELFYDEVKDLGRDGFIQKLYQHVGMY